MVKGCRDEISFITCFALPDLTWEKLVVVDGGEEPSPSHYRDKELCAVHCRMGTGRLCPLTRDVSLGNTWAATSTHFLEVPNQPGTSYK